MHYSLLFEWRLRKTTVPSCFRKLISLKKKKLYICDLFLKLNIFSRNIWAWGWVSESHIVGFSLFYVFYWRNKNAVYHQLYALNERIISQSCLSYSITAKASEESEHTHDSTILEQFFFLSTAGSHMQKIKDTNCCN